MSNGNIISVDTPDNHSIFMDLFRNELIWMLLLLQLNMEQHKKRLFMF